MTTSRVWRVVIDDPGRAIGAWVKDLAVATWANRESAELQATMIRNAGGRAHVEWADLGPWTREAADAIG